MSPVAMGSKQRFEIENVAFIGRTFAEYLRMFDLSVDQLAGKRVFDCPAGACSFVADAADHGIDAVGGDLLYDRTPAQLARTGSEDIDRTIESVDDVAELYDWTYYGDVTGIRSRREQALSRFLRDYARHGDRYIETELPTIPVDDNAFDLVLSAHFLFLYDDRLSEAMHIESVRELLRVGRELRLFPLQGFDARRSALVERVRDTFDRDGYTVEFREVPFEFQRGANTMMVLGAAR